MAINELKGYMKLVLEGAGSIQHKTSGFAIDMEFGDLKDASGIIALALSNRTLRSNTGVSLLSFATGLNANADLNMNSNKITALEAPTDGTDAAHKLYVDTAIADAIAAIPSTDLTPYFKRDGSVTATGSFNMDGHNLQGASSIGTTQIQNDFGGIAVTSYYEAPTPGAHIFSVTGNSSEVLNIMHGTVGLEVHLNAPLATSLLPKAATTVNLGSSSDKFSEAFVNNINTNSIYSQVNPNVNISLGNAEGYLSAGVGPVLEWNADGVLATYTISNNAHLTTKAYVDDAIAAIPATDLSGYYTKTETDALLDDKANAADLANYILATEKGAANGVATLGADSKILAAQLPSLVITDTFVVASEAAMLALSGAEKGDVAVRTDINKSFILAGADYATLADWQELLSPTVATTDQLPEGSTNLYFTAARAKTAAVVNSTAGTETDQAASVSAMKSYVAAEIAAIPATDLTPYLKKDGSVNVDADVWLKGAWDSGAKNIARVRASDGAVQFGDSTAPEVNIFGRVISLEGDNVSGVNSGVINIKTGNSDLISGNVTVATGDSIGNDNTGKITLRTGSTTGARGSVVVEAASLDMNSTKIVQLADGTDANDAVNKGQLDAAIAAIPPTDLSGYYTKTETDGFLADKADTTYVDSQDLAAISSANAYTDSAIAAIPATDLTPYLKHDGSVPVSGNLIPATLGDVHLGSSSAPFASIVAEGFVLRNSTVDYGGIYYNAAPASTVLYSQTGKVALEPANGIVDVSNAKITNLADGTAAGDAVNKGQLDAVAASPWKKFTVASAELSAGALTNDGALMTLPANAVVEGIMIKHTEAFTGGAVSGVTISVGVTGEATKYCSPFDIFQTAAANKYQLTSNMTAAANFGSTEGLRWFATAEGANLNALTAGSVEIWVKYYIVG